MVRKRILNYIIVLSNISIIFEKINPMSYNQTTEQHFAPYFHIDITFFAGSLAFETLDKLIKI